MRIFDHLRCHRRGYLHKRDLFRPPGDCPIEPPPSLVHHSYRPTLPLQGPNPVCGMISVGRTYRTTLYSRFRCYESHHPYIASHRLRGSEVRSIPCMTERIERQLFRLMMTPVCFGSQMSRSEAEKSASSFMPGSEGRNGFHLEITYLGSRIRQSLMV